MLITCQFKDLKKKKETRITSYYTIKQTNPRWIIFSKPGRIIYERHLLSELCACVFKEGINLASYTFACFLAPKPDL